MDLVGAKHGKAKREKLIWKSIGKP